MTTELALTIAREIMNLEVFQVPKGKPVFMAYRDWLYYPDYYYTQADGRSFEVLDYDDSLDAAQLVADEMNRRGFWLKLTSPFNPNDPPANPDFLERWERYRNHWSASFDFHGTTDTHPLWFARSESPAEAICLAAMEVKKAGQLDELPAADEAWEDAVLDNH